MFNREPLVVKSDSDGRYYNSFIPGAIRALYWVPEHRLSTVVNSKMLMLLVTVRSGAAPQMIALSPKVAMAFACVDAMYFLSSECQCKDDQEE